MRLLAGLGMLIAFWGLLGLVLPLLGMQLVILRGTTPGQCLLILGGGLAIVAFAAVVSRLLASR